jgi:hypothetical protein
MRQAAEHAVVVVLILSGLSCATPCIAAPGDVCPTNVTCEGELLLELCYPSAAPCVGYGGSSCSSDGPCPVGFGCYDAPVGRVEAAVPGVVGVDRSALAGVGDRYWITGIPADSPTEFFAQLHIVGTLEGDATGEARVGEGYGLGTWADYDASDSPVDATIVVPLMHVGGEEFLVHFSIAVRNQGSVYSPTRALAILEFGGLPPTAVVHSCQGYNLPVPTLPMTWGRVKSLYR